MTAFDASPSVPSATHATGFGFPPDVPAIEQLSDEAAVQRLYELATNGAHRSPEFARLDELVYQRLMDTYERGGITMGIVHMGACRTV